jgi:hypothetical protein
VLEVADASCDDGHAVFVAAVDRVLVTDAAAWVGDSSNTSLQTHRVNTPHLSHVHNLPKILSLSQAQHDSDAAQYSTVTTPQHHSKPLYCAVAQACKLC